MRTWLWPVAVLLAAPLPAAVAAGDDAPATRRLWDDAFRRKRVEASESTGDGGTTYLGVTVWRLRPATAGEGPSADVRAERVGADARFAAGERLRIGVESARRGYLYVFDAELYADGGRGAPHLVFPTMRTRGGDNRVSPGRLVEIPDRADTPPYFSISRSRPDHVADVLTVLVTPRPLEGIRPGRDQQAVTPEQLARWERAYGAPASRLELPNGAGLPRTPAERDAASSHTRLLTHDDPMPQTLFRIDAPPDGGVLVQFPLGLSTGEKP